MKNFFSIIIIIILVNSTGGIYFTLARNPLTILLFILLAIYWFIRIKKVNISIGVTSLIILFFLTFINYLTAIPGQEINTYMFFLLTLIIAFLANITLVSEQFTRKFIIVLEIYKYHAIIGFVLYFIISNNLSRIELDDYSSFETFLYLFFYTPDAGIRSVASLVFMRNQGLFWEPGILQIYMNILLYLQLFVTKPNKIHVGTTILVILTTFSTTGYLIMLTIFFLYYKSKLTLTFFIKSLPILIIFVIIFTPFLIDNFTDKITGEHATSAYVRLFDFLQSIKIISDFPLTGIGLTGEAYASLQNSYKDIFGLYSSTAEGNTNSILGTLVFWGLITGNFFLYLLYKQNIFNLNKKILFIILFLALFSEPLLLRPFFVFLIMNGLMSIIKERRNIKYVWK